VSVFDAYIGIDYSGAGMPEAGLPGLRIYEAAGTTTPTEVRPSARAHWSRRSAAEWLDTRLHGGDRIIVGIDHGFSFPLAYFDRYGLARDWDALLDDFVAHWPTDAMSVEALRADNARDGNARWRRRTELRTRGTKSVFHFDVQGSVAKSTHGGLPWLRMLRRAHPALHCWPFDGWTPPLTASVIAEVFPTIARALYPTEGRTADQHDAYGIARWLAEGDRDGTLTAVLQPPLSPDEAAAALVEGWILGAG
jgi:hypothetical protein